MTHQRPGMIDPPTCPRCKQEIPPDCEAEGCRDRDCPVKDRSISWEEAMERWESLQNKEVVD